MERSDFSRSLSTFFGLITLSFGLFLLDYSGILVGPRSILTNVIIPAQGFFYKSGQALVSNFKFLVYWRSGTAKINNLEERVRELTVEALKVKDLEAENKALREQVGVPFAKGRKMVMAGVVGYSSTLMLDRGSLDGVSAGMVVSYKDIFLGRVSKTYLKSSVATVSLDPSSKITAITAKTRARGIAQGQFGSSIFLEKVLLEESLQKDDLALTSGEDGNPKGLIIGKIVEVKKEDTGLFQRAKLDPPLDFYKLDQVFVITE